MWGQAQIFLFKFNVFSIIPTRVGTSRFGLGFTRTDEDHPHACGDKRLFYFFHNTNLGSSPRVWGQAVAQTAEYIINGIIPTRVGTRVGEEVMLVRK